MAYRNIHEKFWTDMGLRRLSNEDKYIFFYLITNPCSHFSGIYYLPQALIVEETGLSQNRVQASLQRLTNISEIQLIQLINDVNDRVSYSVGNKIEQSVGNKIEQSVGNKIEQSVGNKIEQSLQDCFVLYDDNFKIVWVKNCLRYQLVGRFSPQQIKAVESHLATLQPSNLIKLFLDYYKYRFGVTFFYQDAYPISTFSQKSAVSVSESESESESVSNNGYKVDFDFKENKFKNLDKKIEFYKEKFPAVDIESEVLKMEGWIVSNPKNKKSNYERFVFNWLCRAQDNAKTKKVSPFDQI